MYPPKESHMQSKEQKSLRANMVTTIVIEIRYLVRSLQLDCLLIIFQMKTFFSITNSYSMGHIYIHRPTKNSTS